MIKVELLNQTFLRVFADDSISQELSDYFTFDVPGARFTPKFRAKMWDGKIRLFNLMRKTLYTGLLNHLERFAKDNDYEMSYGNGVKIGNSLEREEVVSFVDGLNLHGHGEKIVVRDYQYDAIYTGLYNRRVVLLSPTASGKSAIIYSILRYHLQHNRKCLIVVPTTSLVEQMYSDFIDYSSHNGWDVSEYCHRLYSGMDKNFGKSVLISTWQSLVKKTPAWFNQFNVVFGDEAHLFKAQSLTGIMENMPNIQYRIGTTGTIDGKFVHKLVLEGVFGPVYDVTTTKKLMTAKHITNLKIKCLVLRYDAELSKLLKKTTYQDEIDFVTAYQKRNMFIANLAIACEGNTLVLFQLVEKHGKPLMDLILNKAADKRKVFFVYGKTKVDVRESVRELTAMETNAIIVASYGVMSTGVNLPSIENIIFASPSKSKIRNLQSIGRGLRLSPNKDHCNLFDIADNLTYKRRVNFGMKHLEARCKIYAEEDFDFKIINIPI